MAKFHGIVGFIEYEETSLDVYTPTVTEREYSGDLLKKTNRFTTSSSQINDNLTINNQISIIADPYINEHFPSIRYVNWKGCNWKVESVDDQFPRLILTLGGVYNGETS